MILGSGLLQTKFGAWKKLWVCRLDFKEIAAQVLGARPLQVPMKIFIILILSCGSLYAADMTNSVSTDKRLFEITFAKDDMPPEHMFHIVYLFWISEKRIGGDELIYGWADHGSFNYDANAKTKAEQCKKLLKGLEQPKDLPASPNQIVTVKYFTNDKTIVELFPIDRVPYEVHQMLTIIGCPDDAMGRLKFIEKPPDAPKNSN